MTTYTMRRATPADLDTVMRLLDARIAWLGERGSDQWSTRDFRPVMTRAIANRETWLLSQQDRPVATLTLASVGDPDFWTPQELETPALYISKLATDLSHRGRGLGAMLINWANAYGADRDVSTLRWDVWRTNHALQDYYARIGLTPLRIAEVPGRWSGVLYEVAFKVPKDSSVITTHAPYGPLLRLDSSITTRVDLGLGGGYHDPYDAAPPAHSHTLAGLKVQSLDSPIPGPARELVTPGEDSHRTLLYNPGTGWRLRSLVSHQIAEWTDQPDLHAGQLYHLGHQTTADGTCHITLNGHLPEETADASSCDLTADPRHMSAG